MKILVLLKQVLDPETPLEVSPDGTKMTGRGGCPYRMNRYDEYAFEAALTLQDFSPDTIVDALSVGPPRVETLLKRALELGVREAIRLPAEEEHPWPDWVAARIASWARPRDYNLILAGALAEDDQAGQVGPLVAAMLGWPALGFILAPPCPLSPSLVRVTQEQQGGQRAIYELSLPAVLSFQSGEKGLRYPRLSQVLQARTRRVTQGAVDQDKESPPVSARRFCRPENNEKTVFLPGSAQEKAAALWEMILSRGLGKIHAQE